MLAHTVWLVWDDLDDPTREMAARVIAAEADRFADLHIRHLQEPQAFDCRQTIAEGILQVQMLPPPPVP